MGSSSGAAGEDASLQVSFVSRELIAPARPTHRHAYYLSCFDIFWKDVHYNQRVLFYDTTRQGADGAVMMVETLKSSLARCLVHYYPWCGRLSHAAAGQRLSIDCNDAGVEFVEASLPHLPISRLSSQGFQTKPFFENLCAHVDHTGDCLYSSPLLSIQVTHFSDGGLALGITQSHVVADGPALWNFMVSWGECARGLPLSVPPVLNRELLALPNPSLEKATWKIDAEVKEEDIEEQQEEVLGHKNGEGVGTLASLDEERIPCVFKLAASAVKKLKEEDGGVHTSYEVTGAHLWQRVTVARQNTSQQHTVFSVLANCRSRLKPPLPAGYFGNVINFGMAVSTSGRICKESLHGIASRIHESSMKTVQEETLISLMHWLETHNHELYKEFLLIFRKDAKIVNVSSSSRFPVYEVDFGWGKPMAVRSPKVPGDGEFVFFGGNPHDDIPGDVEMCASLPRGVLRRLLEDPLFLGHTPSDPFQDVCTS